jgi:signal transduction histidine kinase
MLTFIVKRGEDMNRIITDFLDFQAMEDGKLKLDLAAISLNDIARGAVGSNTDYARSKEIDLRLELDGNLPIVNGDEARLNQVTQNLVGNAIKFCSKGAQIVVHTSVNGGDPVLGVTDSGPGLTEEDLAMTFTKYARLSNKPTGDEKSSGLGLAICKEMIELHGGQIGVYNNPERGATFWFSLPAD